MCRVPRHASHIGTSESVSWHVLAICLDIVGLPNRGTVNEQGAPALGAELAGAATSCLEPVCPPAYSPLCKLMMQRMSCLTVATKASQFQCGKIRHEIRPLVHLNVSASVKGLTVLG